MKSFTLESLTEGIRERHVGAERSRLIEKWSRTGLLRGLDGVKRETMAQLLENQAAQVLKESNALSTGGGSVGTSGQIQGFTNIAFPIVRRVFGSLVANELVSIQPMSLPSGLLFYLDYTYGANRGGGTGVDGDTASGAATYVTGASIYGNPAGKAIQSGSLAVGGMYDLAGSGFSKVHASANLTWASLHASGAYGTSTTSITSAATLSTSGTDGKLLQFDPQVTTLVDENGGLFKAVILKTSTGALASTTAPFDSTMIKDVALYVQDGQTVASVASIPDTVQGGLGILNVRRLNQLGTYSGGVFTPNGLADLTGASTAVLLVVSSSTADADLTKLAVSYVQSATLSADSATGSTLTIPTFESNFAVDPSPAIPEIDIKIENIAVTAETRKLRARWSPELAQDLNAYHSLDAEVELTQILSEQIALELDREILNDLLTQARGANYYWSRAPGKFVNKTSGAVVSRTNTLQPGPAFTGTVREWYETLVETIIDVANEIHRKTLRGSANFIVVSPDVATMLEASVLYRPAYSVDGSGQVGTPFQLGAEKIGTLSNRFTVYKDPYFPRNKILVGFKGGSYLETGYVYAPYVPLIVTPTIYAPEDFTPRKGVMTRYGKKMVRADFYGTVTVLDLNII